MALLTKKEFAAACGLSTRELAVYIGRKKVTATDSDFIDDTDVVNSEFMKWMAAKKQTGGNKSPKQKGNSSRTVPGGKKKEAAADHEADKIKSQQTTELYELTKRAKAAQITTQEREAFILQARIQKMNGELIPTDLVKQLFASHFREVTLAFKQALDSLLLEIGTSTKMNENQIKVWRMKMVALLNESVNKSVEGSKKSVANVVAEYQQSKKIG